MAREHHEASGRAGGEVADGFGRAVVPPMRREQQNHGRAEGTLRRRDVHDPTRGGRTDWAAQVWSMVDGAMEGRVGRVVRGTSLLLLGLYLTWAAMLDHRLDPTYVWVGYVVAACVGAFSLFGASWRGSAPAVLLTVFWVAWWLSRPVWSSWEGPGRVVARETASMAAVALVTLATAFAARGHRFGVHATRGMWLAIALSTVPVGLFESVTGWHYSPLGRYEPPSFSPAVALTNPNNFACLLVVCLGVVLLWMTERVSIWARAALAVLAACCLLLILLTLSRLALAAALVVVALAGRLEWERRRVGRTPWTARHRGTAAAAAVAALALLAASFVWPPLARFNPVAGLVAPDGAATARADSLRLQLVEAGLQMWGVNPWWGIGGGRFETLLAQTRPDVVRVMPMHNGFVELLTEYGLALAGPLSLLIVVLAWRAVVPSRQSDPGRVGRPSGVDVLGARYLLVVYLIGFLVGGVLVSSSLRWTLWWLFLASAASTAWWIAAARRLPA